jgi:mersacidin/lichenicidin family type 2 lantibiotic
MGDLTTIRAWKDLDFRASLEETGRTAVADSPVGTIELADEDLGDASGGAIQAVTQTSICATSTGCVTTIIIAISDTFSCGACDTTLWHGSCSASSIGCC